MSFIIQRISGPRVLLQEFRQSVLEIGRGTSAQLRSENPSVALEHAVIEASEGGFDLVTQGYSGLMSITGEGPGRPPVKCGAPITDCPSCRAFAPTFASRRRPMES